MANNAPALVFGNVVRDPELVELASGAVKAQFSIASERRYVKAGEWTGDTSFFNVVCWRDLARDAAKLLKKGTPILLAGYWQQRSWENDEGDKRSVVEIVAENIGVQLRGIDGFSAPERRTGPAASSNEPDDAPW